MQSCLHEGVVLHNVARRGTVSIHVYIFCTVHNLSIDCSIVKMSLWACRESRRVTMHNLQTGTIPRYPLGLSGLLKRICSHSRGGWAADQLGGGPAAAVLYMSGDGKNWRRDSIAISSDPAQHGMEAIGHTHWTSLTLPTALLPMSVLKAS